MISNPARRRQGRAETAYGDTMKFGALEGWRGVCALLVAVLHFRSHIVSHLDAIPLVTNSYLLVDFFFVLSGFVISHAYAERLSSVRDIGWFAVRRFGRLWPLHATVLIVWAALEVVRLLAGHHSASMVVHAAFTDSRTPAGLSAGLLLLNGLTNWRGALWNVPSWTVSVEFWTYLVFALTCVVPARGRYLAAVALCLLGPAVLIMAGVQLDTFGYGFFRCIFGFFLGNLTYAAYRRLRSRALRWPTLTEGVVLALLIVFLMVVRRGVLPMGAPLLFAGVVYVFAFDSGAFSRALRSRPMDRLGTWSYSIYLVHFLILVLLVTAIRAAGRALGADNVAAQDPSGAFQRVLLGNAYAMDLIALGYLAVVIWIAAIAYRRIEDPGRRYFNALAVRIFRRRAEVASPQCICRSERRRFDGTASPRTRCRDCRPTQERAWSTSARDGVFDN